MLGPNFKRGEFLRPIKIVPTLKIRDTDNFRRILMPLSNILIFSQSPLMEHHIFQFFQHFISFPQVPIYLEYHHWWLDKRFLLFLHVNIAKITCGYGWNDRTTFPQPFILLLKLTTTARFSRLRDSLRLPETVILDHWFISIICTVVQSCMQFCLIAKIFKLEFKKSHKSLDWGVKRFAIHANNP